MTPNELFDILDLNKNGVLSRLELHEAARRMAWHWREAPVFAVLDLFTAAKPMSRDNFIAFMNQIIEDPYGPYGKVLLNLHPFLSSIASKRTAISKERTADVREVNNKPYQTTSKDKICNDMSDLLKHTDNIGVANTYQKIIENMNIKPIEISSDDAALLIIDPQRSFTRGVWMKSIGSKAELEVKPIRFAFEKCAQFLIENFSFVETMFTRCPFPPGSYDWDDALAGIIDAGQLYFIKPGNSVLFPNTNGFREWVEGLMDDGKKILVMAGCTLNSCIRKSSIDTHKYFKEGKLQIVVDLSLSGARAGSYMQSSLYDGLSAVESGVREMTDAGVRVAQCVQWI
ncbi:MAG: hypothetical protein OEV45_04460 [Desulfobacteraceae bacterium]|nr:hypothetical protein [Desulfobacteraceae bacterium]